MAEHTFGPGYDAAFLAHPVPPPTPGQWADDLVEVSGAKVLPYTHYSVALSASRRLPRWVAWNIDATTLHEDGHDPITRTGMSFRADPRVDKKLQTLGDVYSDNRLDNGHIARRGDLIWGDRPEAEQANFDSFYFTNICPQMDDFNQSSRKGLWGMLENAVLAEAHLDTKRISVFGGPILADDDPAYRTTLVPREFWKLITYVVDGDLRARQFLVTQSLEGLRDLDPLQAFHTFELTLDDLGTRTGLGFDAALAQAGTKTRDLAGPREVHQLADISW